MINLTTEDLRNLLQLTARVEIKGQDAAMVATLQQKLVNELNSLEKSTMSSVNTPSANKLSEVSEEKK